jgi:ferredoxin
MVKVDKKKCIGCGACASICSEIFEMKDDGKAEVKTNAKKDVKGIKEAIKNCPVVAISDK